jgi:alpha-tubulin suppressor-like RCC1 family protein
MAIARDGTLWAWGKSKRGQLGLGANVIHAQTPQRVEALSGQHVVQVIR